MKTWLFIAFTGFFIGMGCLCHPASANPPADAPSQQQPQTPAQESGLTAPAPSASGSVSSPALLETSAPGSAPEPLSVREKAVKTLLQKDFAYNPGLLTDPFVPFIKPPEPAAPEMPAVSEEDETLPPEMQRPLTPLQRMSIGEIERGLKAIVWGELGRKAIIQDSAGKGYIVGVGTPAGGSSGIITQIFNDRLIIQQQVWDKDQKKLVPRNEVISLRKQAEG